METTIVMESSQALYEIDKRVKEQGKKLVLWGCSIGEEDMSEQNIRRLKVI